MRPWRHAQRWEGRLGWRQGRCHQAQSRCGRAEQMWRRESRRSGIEERAMMGCLRTKTTSFLRRHATTLTGPPAPAPCPIDLCHIHISTHQQQESSMHGPQARRHSIPHTRPHDYAIHVTAVPGHPLTEARDRRSLHRPKGTGG